MKHFLLALLLTSASALHAAESETQFFARESADEFTHIALTFDGDKVSGTQIWQPKDAHGSRGTLGGIRSGGGILQVVHEYTIEGSEQAEEEVLKLQGDKLFIGKGELVEQNGRMNLKEPNKVSFETVLERVAVTEPKPGTGERKAIMDAMRVPVAKHVGQPVIFTGRVLKSGSWARFHGDVAPADPKRATGEGASDLELDFFALLDADAHGAWHVLHWGFSGDISVREEAREKFPRAPWVLFE